MLVPERGKKEKKISQILFASSSRDPKLRNLIYDKVPGIYKKLANYEREQNSLYSIIENVLLFDAATRRAKTDNCTAARREVEETWVDDVLGNNTRRSFLFRSVYVEKFCFARMYSYYFVIKECRETCDMRKHVAFFYHTTINLVY